jgi:hypothetical protein
MIGMDDNFDEDDFFGDVDEREKGELDNLRKRMMLDNA